MIDFYLNETESELKKLFSEKIWHSDIEKAFLPAVIM